MLASLPLLGGCTGGELSALNPAGPAAHAIANVWWVMAWSSVAILLLMVVLATYACRRRTRNSEPTPVRLFLLGGGLVFPAVVLLALLVWGLRSGDAQFASAQETDAYRVHVRAHQWWWEVIYPDAPGGARYAVNHIHAPVGRAIHVTVTSADVIHSFWVPRLGGKIDAIPGRSNTIRLQADEPGVYRGVCAEFCGLQHATMAMRLTAHREDELAVALQGLATERVVP